METQASLVGAERVVPLHAIAAIHSDPALVVFPLHAKPDQPVGLKEALEEGGVLKEGTALRAGRELAKCFADGLNELRLVGVSFLDFLDQILDLHRLLPADSPVAGTVLA